MSDDELRLQVGHKLHDYGVRGQDNDYLTDYVLNLLESEKQKARESTLTVALHTMKDIFRKNQIKVRNRQRAEQRANLREDK